MLVIAVDIGDVGMVSLSLCLTTDRSDPLREYSRQGGNIRAKQGKSAAKNLISASPRGEPLFPKEAGISVVWFF